MKADMLHDSINNWRIVPRLAVGLYGIMCYNTGEWFMALDAPTTQQTTFATALFGAAAVWFGFYVNSGGGKK